MYHHSVEKRIDFDQKTCLRVMLLSYQLTLTELRYCMFYIAPSKLLDRTVQHRQVFILINTKSSIISQLAK